MVTGSISFNYKCKAFNLVKMYFMYYTRGHFVEDKLRTIEDKEGVGQWL